MTPSQGQHQIPREMQRRTRTTSWTITPLSLESHGKKNATWAPSHQASSWWTSWLGKATAAKSHQHCPPFPCLGHSPLPIRPRAPCSAWTAKNQLCLSGILKPHFSAVPHFCWGGNSLLLPGFWGLVAPQMLRELKEARGCAGGRAGDQVLPQQHSLKGIMFLKSSCLTFLSRTFLSYTFIF